MKIINKEETELKDEEDNKNSKNKETIYDKVLFLPKYHLNPHQAPTLIYDNGNSIALGDLWNRNILIKRLEDSGNKKEKLQKNINIISTNVINPINHMKIDLRENFVICPNKIWEIYIYYRQNK